MLATGGSRPFLLLMVLRQKCRFCVRLRSEIRSVYAKHFNQTIAMQQENMPPANTQPPWRNGLAHWTSNSKVVGSSPTGGDPILLPNLFYIIYCCIGQ